MKSKFSQIQHITKRFQKIFNFFFKNDDVSKNDVINLLKFYTNSAWNLRIKIYTTKKPEDMCKINLLPFRK